VTAIGCWKKVQFDSCCVYAIMYVTIKIAFILYWFS